MCPGADFSRSKNVGDSVLGRGVYQHHLERAFHVSSSWSYFILREGWSRLRNSNRQLREYWSGTIKQIRRAPFSADKWSRNQEQSHLDGGHMLGKWDTF